LKYSKVIIILVSGAVFFAYLTSNLQWVEDWRDHRWAGFDGFWYPLVSCLAAICFPCFLFMVLTPSSKEKCLRIIFISTSLTISILAVEKLLRLPLLKGLNLETYSERKGDAFYFSPYGLTLEKLDKCGGAYLHVHQPFSTNNSNNGEYAYMNACNSLGLRDTEFAQAKDTNEVTILGLGDSFAEGAGAPADSAWIKQLGSKLNARGPLHYVTMNGGVSGSDLFFCYDLFQHCLAQYKPGFVILDLNSTDISDVIIRGGDERFGAHGCFRNKKGPWWEFFFGSSYMVRLVAFKVFGVNWLLLTATEQRRAEDLALVEIEKKVEDFLQLSHQKHFKFLLLIQPLPYEIEIGKTPLDRLKFNKELQVINLMGFMQRAIPKDSLKNYYWPIDRHFNSKGYGIIADAIYENGVCN